MHTSRNLLLVGVFAVVGLALAAEKPMDISVDNAARDPVAHVVLEPNGHVALMLADDNAIKAMETGRIKAYSRHAPMVNFGANGAIAYHGWQFVEAGNLARAFSSFRLREGGYRRAHVVGVFVNDCRKALDPIEMAPVEGAIRIGDLMVGGKAETPSAKQGDAGDNMKDVDDKDL